MLDMGNLDAGSLGVGGDPGSAAFRGHSQWNDAVPPEVARTPVRRRRVLALVAAIMLAVGVLAFLVLVVVPSASAAGGCGGG